MKFYSFKTSYSSGYFDIKEWKKHITGLERKVDSLWSYLNLVRPNYSTVNWNSYDKSKTEAKQMEVDITNEDKVPSELKGAIYIKDGTEYYFLKCFNNNDLVWCKNNMIIINDYPKQDYLSTILNFKEDISKEDIIKSLKNVIEGPLENTWLLVDSNNSDGYIKIPSISGYGEAFTLKWGKKESKKYYLHCEPIKHNKGQIYYFFNNPKQVRWNKHSWTTNANQRMVTTFNKDIEASYSEDNTPTIGQEVVKEFYQGQKQLMHNTFIRKENEERTEIVYEPVMADYVYKNNPNSQEFILQKPNNNLEVYYW